MCLVDWFDCRCKIKRLNIHHLSFEVIFVGFQYEIRDLYLRYFGSIFGFIIRIRIIFISTLHFVYE